MAFGIDPTSLSLSPTSYLQHRRARKSQDIQEAQYEKSSQDFADRFRESMISKEADRKARFAETEFNAEQKLLIEKAKLEQKTIADKAKTDKETRTWAENRTVEAIKNGSLTWDQYNEGVDYFLGVRTGQPAQQPQIEQPQFQPAGAEGGYDLRTEEAALEAEMARMNQPAQEEWQGVPYRMPEERAVQPAQEIVPPPVITAPKAPEVPQSVAGTDYEPEYVAIKERNKNRVKPKKVDYTKMGLLGKRKIVDIKAFNSDMKTFREDKYAGEKELREIVRDAKKIGKLTPAQQINFAEKILEVAAWQKDFSSYSARQVKWAKDLITKYTGGAGTEQVFGAEQEKLIQNNIQAYGKSREEVIKAMQAQGLL